MIVAFLALAAAQPLSVGRDQSLPFPPVTGDSGLYPLTAVGGYPLSYEERAKYEESAKALQDEMASLKRSDGGRLSWAHKLYLHKKLIALLEAYDHDLERNGGR